MSTWGQTNFVAAMLTFRLPQCQELLLELKKKMKQECMLASHCTAIDVHVCNFINNNNYNSMHATIILY